MLIVKMRLQMASLLEDVRNRSLHCPRLAQLVDTENRHLYISAPVTSSGPTQPPPTAAGLWQVPLRYKYQGLTPLTFNLGTDPFSPLAGRGSAAHCQKRGTNQGRTTAVDRRYLLPAPDA